MNDQEWLEALRSLPPLTPEQWAAVHSGGRLLGPDNYRENQVNSTDRHNRAIEQYNKARTQPTPEQRGEKPMQGGSARRVKESESINGSGKRR